MSGNVQKLGNILSDRMKKTASSAVPTTLELGIINGNLSLTTDSLKTAIPKGDYMVNIMLASKPYAGGEYIMPDSYRALKGGDRVLVAWCGNEPVVVSIVVSS